MATSLIKHGEIEDLTTCPVCMERYDKSDRKPKFLQCSHTACVTCLLKIFSRNQLLCPICRQPSTVPNVGVKGIPNNNYALALIEHVGPEAPSASSLPAQIWGNFNLVEWCFKCWTPASPLCSVLPEHITQLLSAEGMQKARNLKGAMDKSKQNWASAATIRRQIQSQLQLTRSSLKNLQFRLEAEIEENDSQLAALISLLDLSETENIVTPANFESQSANHCHLLSQSVEKLRAAEASLNGIKLAQTATNTKSEFELVTQFIAFAENKEKKIPGPSPNKPNAGKVPRTAAAVAPPQNIARPMPPAVKKFRLIVYQGSRTFGVAEMILLRDVLFLSSQREKTRKCVINSSSRKLFVSFGKCKETGTSLPVIPNPYCISKPGDVGISAMNLTGTEIEWSFTVLTGHFTKNNVKEATTFGYITEGLEVFCLLCCLNAQEKNKRFSIIWSLI